MDKAQISALAAHLSELSSDQRKNLFDSIRQVIPAPRRTKYMRPTMSPKQEAFLCSPNLEILYGGAAGGGKLAPLNSKICTPKGWLRLGDIKIGTLVSDPTTGTSSIVIGVYPQGEQDIYEVTMDDGAKTRVGLDHLWAYKPSGNRYKKPRTKFSSERLYAQTELGRKPLSDRWNSLKIGTTQTLIDILNKGSYPRIPLTEPVAFSVNGRTGTGDVPPYLIGLMLGDGSLASRIITACDDEIRDYLKSIGFKPLKQLHKDGKPKSWNATGTALGRKFSAWLINHRLNKARSWEKFLPQYILTSTIEYRLEILRGLMDTDGTADKRGRCYFTSTSEKLADGVRSLVWSLGGKCSRHIRQTHYSYKSEKRSGRPAFQLRVQLPKTSAVFKMNRKRSRCTDSWNGGYELMREVRSIKLAERADAVCIKVSSPYGLYIADDFIVTHNTEALLAAALQYVDQSNYDALILRRTYAELEMPGATIPLSHKLLSGTDAHWRSGRFWQFPNGATLNFGYLTRDDDKWQYGCFSPDTEMLTKDGWKLVSHVQVGEMAATLDAVTREMKYEPVTHVWAYDFSGEMVDLYQRNGCSFSVTPNHAVWATTNRVRDTLRSFRADEIPFTARIPQVAGIWNGTKSPDEFIFASNGNNGKTLRFTPIEWMSLLGWYVSEGSLDWHGYKIRISQVKESGRMLITEQLGNCAIKSQAQEFYFCNKALYQYLLPLGKAADKHIPPEVKEYPADLLLVLLKALLHGDGTWYDNYQRGHFVTSSTRLKDDVCEIAVKCGYRATVDLRQEIRESRPGYGTRFKMNPMWHVALCKRMQDTWIASNIAGVNSATKRIPYVGKVFCVTVPPHHTVLIRHRGRISWSGQSANYNYIAFDEAAEFPNVDTYKFLFSRLRRGAGVKIPSRMRLGANPIGPGAVWLKKRFIATPYSEATMYDSCLACEHIHWKNICEHEHCDCPSNPDSEARLYIPAKLDDNPFIDVNAYLRTLAQLDPFTRIALRNGDWDAKPPGKMFRREWFQLSTSMPRSDEVVRVRFWDLAATQEDKNKNPSYTCGVRMAYDMGRFYIENVIRRRETPGKVKEIVKQTAQLDGPSVQIWIEQEPGSSGIAVISDYITYLPMFSVRPFPVTGSKENRAVPFASQAEARNIYLFEGDWNEAYLEELEQFPSSTVKNDQVDASSGAYQVLAAHGMFDMEALASAGERVQPDWNF